jgi:hypothetical protein
MINRPVKRLFAFGCSFTKYHWACWPEIVAEELDVPFYNYGKSGAGNQFIANMITQADIKHKFTEDDLIMVCWTNVSREDKWINGEWITPGNIYTQNVYSDDYVKKWADPLGYLVRDCATISLVNGYLKNTNCQFHFFSMCDLHYTFDLNENNKINDNMKDTYKQLCDAYNEILSMPSFYNLLWHNDIHENKFKLMKQEYGDYFNDGHPNPLDHLNFLFCLFPQYKFKESTIRKAKLSNDRLTYFILNQIKQLRKRFTIYQFKGDVLHMLTTETLIKQSQSNIII